MSSRRRNVSADHAQSSHVLRSRVAILTTRIIAAQNARTYETEYGFAIDGRLLPFGPEYDATSIAREFFYSPRQVQLDILLTIFTTFKMNVASVTTRDDGFIVVFESGEAIDISVIMIKSQDQLMTDKILGLGAALQQWFEATPLVKSALAGKHVSLLMQSLPSSGTDQELLTELQQLAASDWLATLSEKDELVNIPSAYRGLASVDTKVMISVGIGESIQVTRGGLAVPPPHVTGSQVQNAAHRILRERLETHPTFERNNWVILWFQPMYELFTVNAIDGALLAANVLPLINRIYMGDGTKVLEIVGD